MILPTRDNFDNSKRIIRKLFGPDRYAVGSDINEIGQAADNLISQVLRLLATEGLRFGTDWIITGGTNQVTVAAGSAVVTTISDRSHVLVLESNTDVTGWTTPSGADRTDFLYLDVEFEQIDPTGDTTLINPAVDEETVNDIRIAFSFTKQEGGSVPSAPAGHYYFTIATIERSDGVDTIAAADITNHLHKWDPLQTYEADKREVLFAQDLVCSYGTADDLTDWGSGSESCWVVPAIPASREDKLRVPYFKQIAANKIKMRFEARHADGTASVTKVHLTVDGYSTVSQTIPTGGSWGNFYELEVNISDNTTDDNLNCLMEMEFVSGAGLYVRKVLVWAESEVLS